MFHIYRQIDDIEDVNNPIVETMKMIAWLHIAHITFFSSRMLLVYFHTPNCFFFRFVAQLQTDFCCFCSVIFCRSCLYRNHYCQHSLFRYVCKYACYRQSVQLFTRFRSMCAVWWMLSLASWANYSLSLSIFLFVFPPLLISFLLLSLTVE